jgi:hypothetical protein
MKWLAFSLIFIAAQAQTPSTEFMSRLNFLRALPKSCSESFGSSSSQDKGFSRRRNSGTVWVSSSAQEMDDLLKAVDADLQAQLKAVGISPDGFGHSYRTRELSYQAPHIHGSVLIGPYYSDPQSNCNNAFAIHLRAEEWSLPPRR